MHFCICTKESQKSSFSSFLFLITPVSWFLVDCCFNSLSFCSFIFYLCFWNVIKLYFNKRATYTTPKPEEIYSLREEKREQRHASVIHIHLHVQLNIYRNGGHIMYFDARHFARIRNAMTCPLAQAVFRCCVLIGNLDFFYPVQLILFL